MRFMNQNFHWHFLPSPLTLSGFESLLVKKQKSCFLSETGFLVRLKGFEPPTFWFVAKHSIQLSYSRIPLENLFSLTARL